MPRRLLHGVLLLPTWMLLVPPVLAVAIMLALPIPAVAHPFGPPPSALIAARGSTVLVQWRAMADDAVAVGVHLGFFGEEVLDAYLEAPAQAAPPAADEEALAASPLLVDYLTEHVVVRQDGDRCEVAVVPPVDFVHDGAQVLHECPAPIEVVEVEITMLHDIHEAYRTFGLAEDPTAVPDEVVFSVAAPRHEIDFRGGAAGRDGDGAPLPAVLTAVGLLVVVGTLSGLAWRRRVRG